MTKEIRLIGSPYSVLIDDADYEWLNEWVWYADKDGYAYRFERIGGHNRNIRMHRQILNAPKGIRVDHKDRNHHNNQRHNLRMATVVESNRNRRGHITGTSKYKGVSFDSTYAHWRADICVDGKKSYLGRYGTETEAAQAYDKRAREHFGDFAYLNFPEEC